MTSLFSPETHATALIIMWGYAAITVLALVFISAPYGRHARSGWGPQLPSRAAWILMELPSVALFAWVFFRGSNRSAVVPLILLTMFQVHYVHRTFIFPFRMRSKGKRTPILLVLMASVFNTLNSFLNAYWISELGDYPLSWLTDPRFIIGTVIFVAGFAINFQSDSILFNLRKPGETGYKIPRGGAFRWVSSPNYMGEILEWGGWAIATWSVPGLAFFVYTVANLGPRAFNNHKWCLERFPDYPKSRKRLIPFII